VKTVSDKVVIAFIGLTICAKMIGEATPFTDLDDLERRNSPYFAFFFTEFDSFAD